MSSKILKDFEGFFIGNEVEHTPFFGLKTLFVSRKYNITEIVGNAKKYSCEHIYLGANNSFADHVDWRFIIKQLLDEGYKVTLDYPIKDHDFVHDILGPTLPKSDNFVRMASCTLENIENMYMNMLIKIDGRSNTGVWTIPIRELLDEERKTDWIDYHDDKVVS